ncbi:tape measure protein [Acinetobacter lwoffii]|uniref:tape measure protein n=1 Tax=Acinetobacter lwoffii TaxID=28090 RepID=UPI002097D34A|nr:tape measure protein [Acinetobacter lwoffii]MCO8069132.1 tape measure protein [Acinetobacter lwoffii]
MSGKNLTFKLIMDADTKGFVGNIKQSEDAAKSVFNAIKQESERLKQATTDASKEMGNIIPKGTSELADKLSQSLNTATGIIKDAGDNAKSTAGNFTDFGNKAEKALGQLKGDLAQAKQNLEAFSKTKASPADIEKAQVQVDQLEKEVQQADQAFSGFQAEVGKANTSLKETDTAAQTAQKGIGVLKTGFTALIGVMGGIGIGLGLRELAEAADSYTNLSVRIQIATREGGDFSSAMAGVHQVALATNSSLDATASLFTRLNTVGKEMGMTQQQALDLTKTVTQAIQIGGGSAQASETAVQQFIQAMQGGVLRGEEFNSIMENGYGLAEALAKGLGVTTGELRKMAENGELSSERVIKAVQSQATQIQETYNQFPTTISNALQRIATSWQIVIGEMDQANGSSAAVADALVVVADNLGIIKVFLDDVGLGLASLIGDLQGGIDASTIDAFKNAISAAYDAVKDLVAQVYEFGVVVLDTLGTSITNTLSIFSSFTGGVSSAGEQVSFLERIFQGLGITFGFVSDGLTAIGIILKVATGNFFMLASAANSVMAALTWGDVSKQFAANADLMKDKAKEYYAEADREAQEFQSKGVQRLNEAAQTQGQKTAERLALSKQELEQLLSDQQSEVNGKKATESEKLNAVQDYAEAAIKANGGVMDGVMQADLLTKGYIVTIDEAGKVSVQASQSAEQAAESAAKKEEALKLTKENVKKADEEYLAYQKQATAERAILEQQIEQAKKSGDLNALASAQSSINAINAKEAELANNRDLRIAELNKANTGSGQVAETAYSRASAAAKLFGVDLDVSLNKVSKSFSSSGNELDGLKIKLDEAGYTGKQAGDVLYQAWEDWLSKAKSQAEIDAANAKMREFEAQGVFSTKQVELGIMAIRKANAELPDELDETGKAFERVGIKTKEQLKLSAQQALMDYNTIRNSGEATAEGIEQAHKKAAQAVALSGDAGVIAAFNAADATQKLKVQIDDTGKASVEAGDKANDSLHSMRQSTDRVRDGVKGIEGSVHSATRAIDGAKSSTEEWADAVNKAKGEFDKAMKQQSKSLGSLDNYDSYNKNDVISMLKSQGYDDKDAKKLAGNIWSQAMEADRDAKMASYGNSGVGGLDTLMRQMYDDAAAKGITTQHGTNKINELLRSINVASTGSSSLNDYAPSIPSVPSARDIDSTPKTTIRIEAGNGQYVDAQVNADQVNPLTQILKQLGTLKGST